MSVSSVPERAAALPELNLRGYLDVLKRRKAVCIQVFALVLAVGMVMASMGKPVYVTSAKLLVAAANSSVSIVDSNNPIATMLAASQPDSVDTQLQVLQSGPFLDEAFRAAHIVTKPGVIGPSVEAQSVENTNIIEITVHGGDPKQITALANTIVRLHLKKTDLLETTGLGNTLEFVRKEKGKAETQLALAERRLEQFRQAHRLVGLTTEKEAQAGEYAALLARTLEAESNLRSAKQQTASLRAELAKEPAELVQVSTRENPAIARLRERLAELKIDRMHLLRELRPASRPVTDLDHEIALVQQALKVEPAHLKVPAYSPNPARPLLETRLRELRAGMQSDQERYYTAAAQLSAQKALMDSLGPSEAQLAELTSDRDAARGAYSMLSDRLRDLEIRAGARVPTARPIEWASVPSTPIRPRKSNSMLVSLLMALTAAMGVVFLQELLDDRVNSPEELERLVPLRTLAQVPLIPPHTPRLVAELPANAPVAEAYRTLRTSIAFAGFDAPIRRLQITSTTKGEGKSTTAVNLATAMARDGKKVVLVDGDMRAPSLHRLLGLPLTPGLSELLAGLAPLEEVLHATETENLLVLPAGSIPPNPAELLGGGAFEPLLQQLTEGAAIVIIDSPPTMPVTDPVIMATRMDAVALVLQFGATRKAGLKQTMDQLTHARARVVGVVFNQVQTQGHYYYHAYPYGDYGYPGSHTNGTAAPPTRAHRNGQEPKGDLSSCKSDARS
jgi:tyrosine-protein kinase Etk/Wzc